MGKLLSPIWHKTICGKNPEDEDIIPAVDTHRGALNIADKKHGVVVRVFRVDTSGAASVYVPIEKILAIQRKRPDSSPIRL